MEDFIGFVTCTSLKGVSIAEAILSKLAEVGIDLLNVRGHCYDGVSNMAGKFNGAQTLIKERVPQAYNVHCNKYAQLKATECADNDGNSSRYSVRFSGKYVIQMQCTKYHLRTSKTYKDSTSIFSLDYRLS